jgi:hypothetical protein
MPEYIVVIPSASRMVEQEKLSQDEVRDRYRRGMNRGFITGKVAQFVSETIEEESWAYTFETDVEMLTALLRQRSNVPGWQKALLHAAYNKITDGEGPKVPGLFHFDVKFQKCPVHGDWLTDGDCNQCYLEATPGNKHAAGRYSKRLLV